MQNVQDARSQWENSIRSSGGAGCCIPDYSHTYIVPHTQTTVYYDSLIYQYECDPSFLFLGWIYLRNLAYTCALIRLYSLFIIQTAMTYIQKKKRKTTTILYENVVMLRNTIRKKKYENSFFQK